jgi:hypothetical protein
VGYDEDKFAEKKEPSWQGVKIFDKDREDRKVSKSVQNFCGICSNHKRL